MNDLGHMHFSNAVLQYSNATPFLVRRRSLIRCIFNCWEDFKLDTLRAHTERDHSAHKFRAVKGMPRTTIRVDITDLQCVICSDNLPDLDLFEKHLNTFHRIETFKDTADVLVPYRLSERNVCQICDEETGNFHELDMHMESTHFPLNICEVCGRGFMDVVKLKDHWNNEHAEKPYACEVCEVRFITEHLMRRHTNYTHKGIGANRCWKCPGDVRFKDHAKKMIHMVEVHKVKRPPMPKCATCGREFATQSLLSRHVRESHETKAFKCKICGFSFMTAKNLSDHRLSVHTGVRTPCVYCARTYASVRDLARHMAKEHSELDRRCPCPRCGVPCENRYKLAQHRKQCSHANSNFVTLLD